MNEEKTSSLSSHHNCKLIKANLPVPILIGSLHHGVDVRLRQHLVHCRYYISLLPGVDGEMIITEIQI